MQNKKGNVAVIAIIIVIVVITAGIVGWMFAKKSQVPARQAIEAQPTLVAQNQPVASTNQSVINQEPVAKSIHEATNWQTYSNAKYGFEFKYPVDWTYELLQNGNEISFFSNWKNFLS